MKRPIDILEDLNARGFQADDAIDVAETALLISALERPAIAFETYLRHIDKLGAAVSEYARGETEDAALAREALSQVVARHYGYHLADDADRDTDAADLSRVIDARAGHPTALAILYLEAARRAGFDAAPLAFRAQLLVRLESEGQRVILDPAGDGAALGAPELRAMLKCEEGNQAELLPDDFETIDNRAVLLRLCRARKRAALMRHRLEDALRAVETAIRIAPEESSLWRESGLLNARLDRIPDAVTALEEYLRRDASEAARYNTSVLLQELRSRLT